MTLKQEKHGNVFGAGKWAAAGAVEVWGVFNHINARYLKQKYPTNSVLCSETDTNERLEQWVEYRLARGLQHIVEL